MTQHHISSGQRNYLFELNAVPVMALWPDGGPSHLQMMHELKFTLQTFVLLCSVVTLAAKAGDR